MSVLRLVGRVPAAICRFVATRSFVDSFALVAAIAPVPVFVVSFILALSGRPAVAAGLPTPSLPFEADVRWIATSATIGGERVAYARFRTALNRSQVRQATLAAWSAGGLLIERELVHGRLLSRRDGAALTTLWLEAADPRDSAGERRGSGGYLIVSESRRLDPSVSTTGDTDGCGFAQLVPPQGEPIRPIAFDDGGQSACQIGIRFALNMHESQVLLERQWRGAGMAPMKAFGDSGPQVSGQSNLRRTAQGRSMTVHSAAIEGRVLHFASAQIELLAWLSPDHGQTWVTLVARRHAVRADEDRNEQHEYGRHRHEGLTHEGRRQPGDER